MLSRLFGSKKPPQPDTSNKFTLANLTRTCEQLSSYTQIDETNTETIIELVRLISELMIWGDQHNPAFFEYFAHKNVLRQFVDLLSSASNLPYIQKQIIQSISMLVQNTNSQMSIFFFLSNNIVNQLIVHPLDLDNEDLLATYISFVKSLSMKVDGTTLHFLFNSDASDFPLIVTPFQFHYNDDSLIRNFIRTILLNAYKSTDPYLLRYLLDTTSPLFFANILWAVRFQIHTLYRWMASQNEKLNYAISTQRSPNTDGAVFTLLTSIEELTPMRMDELNEQITDVFYFMADLLQSNANIPISLDASSLGEKLLHGFPKVLKYTSPTKSIVLSNTGSIGDILTEQLFTTFIIPLLLASFSPAVTADTNAAAGTALTPPLTLLQTLSQRSISDTIKYPRGVFPTSIKSTGAVPSAFALTLLAQFFSILDPKSIEKMISIQDVSSPHVHAQYLLDRILHVLIYLLFFPSNAHVGMNSTTTTTPHQPAYLHEQFNACIATIDKPDTFAEHPFLPFYLVNTDGAVQDDQQPVASSAPNQSSDTSTSPTPRPALTSLPLVDFITYPYVTNDTKHAMQSILQFINDNPQLPIQQVHRQKISSKSRAGLVSQPTSPSTTTSTVADDHIGSEPAGATPTASPLVTSPRSTGDGLNPADTLDENDNRDDDEDVDDIKERDLNRTAISDLPTIHHFNQSLYLLQQSSPSKEALHSNTALVSTYYDHLFSPSLLKRFSHVHSLLIFMTNLMSNRILSPIIHWSLGIPSIHHHQYALSFDQDQSTMHSPLTRVLLSRFIDISSLKHTKSLWKQQLKQIDGYSIHANLPPAVAQQHHSVLPFHYVPLPTALSTPSVLHQVSSNNYSGYILPQLIQASLRLASCNYLPLSSFKLLLLLVSNIFVDKNIMNTAHAFFYEQQPHMKAVKAVTTPAIVVDALSTPSGSGPRGTSVSSVSSLSLSSSQPQSSSLTTGNEQPRPDLSRESQIYSEFVNKFNTTFTSTRMDAHTMTSIRTTLVRVFYHLCTFIGIHIDRNRHKSDPVGDSNDNITNDVNMDSPISLSFESNLSSLLWYHAIWLIDMQTTLLVKFLFRPTQPAATPASQPKPGNPQQQQQQQQQSAGGNTNANFPPIQVINATTNLAKILNDTAYLLFDLPTNHVDAGCVPLLPIKNDLISTNIHDKAVASTPLASRVPLTTVEQFYQLINTFSSLYVLYLLLHSPHILVASQYCRLDRKVNLCDHFFDILSHQYHTSTPSSNPSSSSSATTTPTTELAPTIPLLPTLTLPAPVEIGNTIRVLDRQPHSAPKTKHQPQIFDVLICQGSKTTKLSSSSAYHPVRINVARPESLAPLSPRHPQNYAASSASSTSNNQTDSVIVYPSVIPPSYSAFTLYTGANDPKNATNASQSAFKPRLGAKPSPDLLTLTKCGRYLIIGRPLMRSPTQPATPCQLQMIVPTQNVYAVPYDHLSPSKYLFCRLSQFYQGDEEAHELGMSGKSPSIPPSLSSTQSQSQQHHELLQHFGVSDESMPLSSLSSFHLAEKQDYPILPSDICLVFVSTKQPHPAAVLIQPKDLRTTTSQPTANLDGAPNDRTSSSSSSASFLVENSSSNPNAIPRGTRVSLQSIQTPSTTRVSTYYAGVLPDLMTKEYITASGRVKLSQAATQSGGQSSSSTDSLPVTTTATAPATAASDASDKNSTSHLQLLSVNGYRRVDNSTSLHSSRLLHLTTGLLEQSSPKYHQYMQPLGLPHQYNSPPQLWILPLRCPNGLEAGKACAAINDAHRNSLKQWNEALFGLLAGNLDVLDEHLAATTPIDAEITTTDSHSHIDTIPEVTSSDEPVSSSSIDVDEGNESHEHQELIQDDVISDDQELVNSTVDDEQDPSQEQATTPVAETSTETSAEISEPAPIHEPLQEEDALQVEAIDTSMDSLTHSDTIEDDNVAGDNVTDDKVAADKVAVVPSSYPAEVPEKKVQADIVDNFASEETKSEVIADVNVNATVDADTDVDEEKTNPPVVVVTTEPEEEAPVQEAASITPSDIVDDNQEEQDNIEEQEEQQDQQVQDVDVKKDEEVDVGVTANDQQPDQEHQLGAEQLNNESLPSPTSSLEPETAVEDVSTQQLGTDLDTTGAPAEETGEEDAEDAADANPEPVTDSNPAKKKKVVKKVVKKKGPRKK